ncbi:2Fe-2S iron-sulfur cluster binding domain-containing protein [Tahibacter harae]|uniref:(2Fe-2S)-binding protein n=1 Tax=Tahibacter harae TaxID=2963937 RepID=A0ABT1QTD5_9GAMM|nr:2Fe-2S iron-sulfur cluster-binding protein [Tahibacter harae]MCQ4165562.1 (2Fe-2S)-binding protein [Tahibacter harae]
MSTVRIEFPDTAFPPQEIPLRGCLPLHLSVQNSPLLFGCRSGLCGTCLIEVEAAADAVEPPADDEREALEIYAPGNPRARLACQLVPLGALRVRKIESV